MLRTRRLKLVPFASADAVAFHGLFTNPDVRRFLLDEQIVPLEWVEAQIDLSRASFEAHGYGLWKVALRTGELIGFAGYREFHEPPELQLLYGLHPDFWHQGYATEAARAVMRFGFEECDFDQIVASTDAPNEASIRVMEQLGMRFWKRENKAGLDTVYYALDRSDRKYEV